MPTFVVLSSFTDQGLRAVKESPDRFEGAGPLLEEMGIRVKDHYWLMGRYDLATIVEAPNAEAISRFALTVGLQGNGRTETMRAFSTEEFRKIVGSLA
jgi:uncharacterized protein with GYD domain